MRIRSRTSAAWLHVEVETADWPNTRGSGTMRHVSPALAPSPRCPGSPAAPLSLCPNHAYNVAWQNVGLLNVGLPNVGLPAGCTPGV
jgi:hypothetical protein